MSNPHEIIKKIREIADGRRHYDGADGYNCFDALGDIRDLCDQSLGKHSWVTPQETIKQIEAFYKDA